MRVPARRLGLITIVVAVVAAVLVLLARSGDRPLQFAEIGSGESAPEVGSGRVASWTETVEESTGARTGLPIEAAQPVRVTGRVSWPDSVAAYGATVAQDTHDLPLEVRPAFGEARTGPDGTFAISVPRGVHRLFALAGDARSVAVTIDAHQHDVAGVELVIGRLPRVRGLLTDARGRPVQGEIRVITTMVSPGIDPGPLAKARREFIGCDLLGDFRRDLPADLRLSIRGWAKGHAPTRTVEIEPGDSATDLRLVAREIVDVELTVVHPDASPWQGLEAGFLEPDAESPDPTAIRWAGKTDDRGVIILRGVAAEESCLLAVKAIGSESFTPAFTIDSRLPASRLTIADDDLRAAAVDVQLIDEGARVPRVFSISLLPESGFASPVRVAAKSNPFRVEGLHPGLAYRVLISAAALPATTGADGPKRVSARAVAPGRASATTRFVAQRGEQTLAVPMRALGDLTVLVLDASGAARGGMRIEIDGPTTFCKAEELARTDRDGRAILHRLVAAEHVVRAFVGVRAIAEGPVTILPGVTQTLVLRSLQ